MQQNRREASSALPRSLGAAVLVAFESLSGADSGFASLVERLFARRMAITFPLVTECGLERAADALSRGFSDYLVPIQSSPAILFGMVRADSVDLSVSRVIVRDGEPVGAALVARRGWTCRLAGMAIAPEARKQGVGRTLMAQLLADAKARGERTMVLEVIEQNIPAVKLYEQCGFTKVRRLTGVTGPAPVDLQNKVVLEEIDPRELARTVAGHGLPDLPWQLSAETLATFGPPFLAYRGGPSCVLISNPAVSPVTIRAVITESAARGSGSAAALIRAVMARHSAKEWRASAIFPEEMSVLWAELGLARSPLTQWQMTRPLS